MFFIKYSTEPYEHDEIEFSTEAEVIAFLNDYAGNPDFKFRAIEGEIAVFEPVAVATQYRRKT